MLKIAQIEVEILNPGRPVRSSNCSIADGMDCKRNENFEGREVEEGWGKARVCRKEQTAAGEDYIHTIGGMEGWKDGRRACCLGKGQGEASKFWPGSKLNLKLLRLRLKSCLDPSSNCSD